MADVKPATVRTPAGLGPARVPAEFRGEPRPPVNARSGIEDRTVAVAQQSSSDPTTALISEFISPLPRTTAWLGDPRMTATLEAASRSLAPGGSAEDPADRYAASVVETHLAARRRLTKLTNALLKT